MKGWQAERNESSLLTVLPQPYRLGLQPRSIKKRSEVGRSEREIAGRVPSQSFSKPSTHHQRRKPGRNNLGQSFSIISAVPSSDKRPLVFRPLPLLLLFPFVHTSLSSTIRKSLDSVGVSYGQHRRTGSRPPSFKNFVGTLTGKIVTLPLKLVRSPLGEGSRMTFGVESIILFM